jgi:alpha-1,6-mannosyltransferase
LLPKTTTATAHVRQKQALLLLVFSSVVFRSETAVLLATMSLYLLVTHRATLTTLVPLVAGISLAAIAISVPIDSYFWQKLPLWPELAGFYYNAILGSSSNWGTSPWHYYFTSALPRLLLNPLSVPLIAFALLQPATSRQARDLIIPNILFIAIYSVQPHKEARFIFYVLPALTAAAALGANYIFAHRTKTLFHALVSLLLPVSILASFAASTGMLLLSSLNYPGGDALTQLYAITNAVTPANANQAISVHADVLTCMTGLTLFGQNLDGLPIALGQQSNARVVFDKTEDAAELAKSSFWKKFDYVLAEDPLTVLGGQWKTVGIVHGYAGIEVLKPGVQVDEELAAEPNPEAANRKPRVVGHGVAVQKIRNLVRRFSGGWWIGPRMEPRIHIMKQIKTPGGSPDASS